MPRKRDDDTLTVAVRIPKSLVAKLEEMGKGVRPAHAPSTVVHVLLAHIERSVPDFFTQEFYVNYCVIVEPDAEEESEDPE